MSNAASGRDGPRGEARSRVRGTKIDQDARAVAVTGANTFLGTEILKRLEEDRSYRRVFALDLRRPELPLEKTEFVKIDLTVPTVDGEIAALLADEAIDTVVHCAFLSHPTHESEWAHELEDIGTMHLTNACARTNPPRLVMTSSTLVYGASPENPNFLDEDAPLEGHADSRFINDKVRAEEQVSRFAAENPAVDVTVLRFAPLLGPTVTNMFTRFFSRPVAPVMMGYDPLLQFIHQNDAVRALETVVGRETRGTYNIVGKGVLPYSTVLALMGKVPVPMPHFVARTLSRALWLTQVVDAPPSFLDFLRYLCVADGSKAKRELGFEARYSIKRTINDFVGLGTEDGAPDVQRAQG